VNLHVPAEYGGAGLHALDGVVVGEELAYGCTGMMTAMEGNGLASAPVIIAGSDAQKVRVRCCACICPPTGAWGRSRSACSLLCMHMPTYCGLGAEQECVFAAVHAYAHLLWPGGRVGEGVRCCAFMPLLP